MLRLALVTAAALSLAGCKNMCDEIDVLNVEFQARHKECGLDMTNRTFSKANCNANLANCSKADQEKIKKYTDCLKNLPVCTRDTMNASWSEALQQCAFDSGVVTMTPACRDAIQTGRIAPGTGAGSGGPTRK